MGGNKILGVKTPEIPLSSWVFKGKSFDESLRTSGSPIEQAVNKWLLKSVVKPVKNWISPTNTEFYPMTKGLSSNPQYFQQQQQMLQNMQAQQQSKLANLRSEAPSYPAATPQTTTTQSPVSSSSATTPTTATLAQTKSSDTASASDLPMEFGYKPPTKDLKVATANTFSLPNMSDIKFGGA
jgi:hypothetical protein